MIILLLCVLSTEVGGTHKFFSLMMKIFRYVAMAVMAAILPVVAMGQNEVITSADSLPPMPEAVQKMTKFQNMVMERVAKSQTPPSAGSGNFRVVFMSPPLGSLPEYGFGLGVGACGVFKTDKTNPALYTSTIPLNVKFGFTCPFSFRVLCAPQIYFNNNRLKVAAEISYQQSNEHYFGIGYSENKSIDRDRAVTGYQSRRWQVTPEVEWKLGGSNIYMGVVADFIHDTMRSPGTYLLGNAEYAAAGGTAAGLKLVDVGAGIDISLDTRDVAHSPYNGVWLDARAVYYAKFLGSDHEYGKITLDYRHYKQVGGRRAVLSWGVASSNVVGGDVPFARYATIGDIYSTRGYYGYQYRDRSFLKAHVEYRYMFYFDTLVGKLLLNRFGVAGWTGLATMGGKVLKYDAVLPELGAGLRMQLTPRVNARCDFGYNFVDKHTLFYFGIAEAF